MTKQVQGTVFGDSVTELGEEVGYRSAVVAQATGLTERQLGYWARQGFFEPSLLEAQGSGTRRLYTFKDICILRAYKRLLDTGLTVRRLMKAQEVLKKQGVNDLSQITLCSDGNSVYLVHSAQEIFDLLQGGQGVFSISIKSIWSEMETTMKHFKVSTVEEEMLPPFLRELSNTIEIRRSLYARSQASS
jgi:DNA-binding transcriptional MerR regulator